MKKKIACVFVIMLFIASAIAIPSTALKTKKSKTDVYDNTSNDYDWTDLKIRVLDNKTDEPLWLVRIDITHEYERGDGTGGGGNDIGFTDKYGRYNNPHSNIEGHVEFLFSALGYKKKLRVYDDVERGDVFDLEVRLDKTSNRAQPLSKEFLDVSEENSGPLTAKIELTKQGRRSYLIEVKLRNDGDENYNVFDPSIGLMIFYRDPDNPDKAVVAFIELSLLWPLWMFLPVVKNGGETIFDVYFFAGVTNMPLLSDICNYCDNYPVLPGGEYQIVAEVGYRGSNPFEYYTTTCTASLTLVEPSVKMKNSFFSDCTARFPALLEVMEKF